MASLFTEARKTEMYQFFAVAFNAAPGVTFFTQLQQAVEAGLTTQQIVNEFTTKGEFLNRYPTFLSSQAFATSLVNNVARSSITDAAKANAVNDIVMALDAGLSRSQVIFNVFTNIAATTDQANQYFGVAQQLRNEVNVARYYTEVQLSNSQDPAVLRQVLANVTNTTDTSSNAAIQTFLNNNGSGVSGQTFTLTAGADPVNGTAGNDTITGRISDFASFDTVTGGNGIDTLVLTGQLPTDVAMQPAGGVLDAAFQRTTSIEKLIMAGGVGGNTANATLGAFALAAGLTEVVAGGTGGQNQTFNIQGFGGALTITGSGNAEVVNVDQAAAGAKTLNLGVGADTVNVTALNGATAGSTQINFTSGAVGNGTDQNATIVNAAGNITVNDEGTTIIGTIADQFNVVGLAADGTLDLANQNRGNFRTVVLGTSAADTFSTADAGNQGNVYINAGAGADNLTAAAGANARHFLVGNGGNDVLTITTTDISGRVVALTGDDNDAVTVNTNAGAVNVNLGNGNDSITFTGAFFANGTAAQLSDTVAGGAGRDTLTSTSLNLTALDNTAMGAVQSISGIEALTVSDAQVVLTVGQANTLVTSRVQAGIDAVSLNGTSVAASDVTFDGGVASTLNLGAAATGTITVRSAGTGTTDQVTIANTAVAAAGGAATDAFGNQAIVTAGVETLVINTSAAGTATTQMIGGVTGTPAGTVNFVGGNSVAAGVVDARVVSAAGLTGTAGITATTVTADNAANAFTGSSNADTITLGAGRQNLNLGAGNDTVVVGDAVVATLATGTSSLAGGEGTDTLQMSTANAATLSLANPFNANLSGFEQLSINNQAAGATNTIRVDNFGVNKVISAGTGAGVAGDGSNEVVTFTPPSLAPGQSLTFMATGRDPVTVTNTNTFVEDAGAVASRINSAFNAQDNLANVNSVVTQYDSVVGLNSLITLTAETPFTNQNLNNLTVSTGLATQSTTPTITVTTAGNDAGTAGATGALREVTVLDLDGDDNILGPAIPGGPVDDAVFMNGGSGATTNTVRFDGHNGASFNFVAGGMLTGTALRDAIISAANADTDWAAAYTTVAAGNNVQFTSIAFANTTNITRTDEAIIDGRPQPSGLLTGENLIITPGNAGTATVESQRINWQALTGGQSVTVAGRKVEATTMNLTATEVADAFEQGINNSTLTLANGARVTGDLGTAVTGQPSGFVLGVNSLGDGVTFISAVVAGNVPDALTSVTNGTLNSPTLTRTDGVAAGALGAAGQIILQNLQTNGTLEITAASTGTHEVRILNSGLNTNDVLNLELTNSAAGAAANAQNVNVGNNYGTVRVDNTERVNVLLKDTGTAANTAATKDAVILNAAQATSLVITGNNGVDIAGGSVLTALNNFDASGIVGNGADDTAANLGVTFNLNASAVTTTVAVRGGAGNDEFLNNTAAAHTFDLSNGGADRVDFAATRALNGQDTINGFTAGTGANADLLNLNGFIGVTAQDGNGAAAGLIFNATAANTVGDLNINANGVGGNPGANSVAFLVTDGNATINLANVKSQLTGATAQNGEILVADGASAYILHAASAGSNTFNVYRAFDADANGGVVNAQVELLGVVNLTNTFGDIIAGNIN